MEIKLDSSVPINRRNPIKRNNKFFGGEDYDLQMMFATEYMEQWANQTIVLYQIDSQKTKVNDIYKEANRSEIRFKTPVELTVVYDIQESEMKAYSDKNSKGMYAKPGKMTFSVLVKELEEKKCDINRGDYIRVDISPDFHILYTVIDDGRMNMTANKSTLYGKMPFYRQIQCAYADPIEVNL